MIELICLSNGMMTLIDSKHYVNILDHGPWHYQQNRTTLEYAYHQVGKGKNRTYEQLHKFIAKEIGLIVPLGYVIDHKNGDGLDNREENLRLATYAQSAMNRGIPSNSSTKVKGVTERKKLQKYEAGIKVNGSTIYLGTYNTKEEAKQVRLAAEIRYFGEFRREE